MKKAYYAIIPTAGSGSRMQATKPKQYLKIAGKTVLERSIEALAHFPKVEKIYVALEANDPYWAELDLPFAGKIETLTGGATRAHSVFNALQKLREMARNDDWVLVHDAARPGLRASDLERLINSVGDHPVGGILGIPLRDTLKWVSADHEIIKTPSREHLWLAQTPQLFRIGILWKALNEALKDAYFPTDDSGAVENIGLKPLMVLGGMHNLKITYAEDLLLAEKNWMGGE